MHKEHEPNLLLNHFVSVHDTNDHRPADRSIVDKQRPVLEHLFSNILMFWDQTYYGPENVGP